MARILVVDDEAAIRELITAIVEDEGHEVRQARDGVEALEAIIEDIPDLVVLDLAMPGMDGWKLLEELHARGLRRQTRIVIVSANYDPSTAPHLHKSRVGHFLAKPFEPESLVQMIDEALLQNAEELYDKLDRVDHLARLIERVDQVLS